MYNTEITYCLLSSSCYDHLVMSPVGPPNLWLSSTLDNMTANLRDHCADSWGTHDVNTPSHPQNGRQKDNGKRYLCCCKRPYYTTVTAFLQAGRMRFWLLPPL